MENFLSTLEIQHFKSIKQMNLRPKRVNVFIGEPNVGKSNILEAISLLGACCSRATTKKFMEEFIRYEEISNLFFDDDLSIPINVKSDKLNAHLRYHLNNIDVADLTVGDSIFIDSVLNLENKSPHEINKLLENVLSNANFYSIISNKGQRSNWSLSSFFYSPVKPFLYKESTEISNKFPKYLLPPHGDNLFTIITQNSELRAQNYGVQGRRAARLALQALEEQQWQRD